MASQGEEKKAINTAINSDRRRIHRPRNKGDVAKDRERTSEEIMHRKIDKDML